MAKAPQPYPKPYQRRLRAFAFDPQASLEVDTAPINNALVTLPWELHWEDPLEKGPVNEYLEVVDYDPASGCFYPPVDLNDPILLAQDGLAPSDGNPQFHQQMVFAVAMKTIRAFERALGRLVFWMRENGEGGHREYVRRLRIYPHAMRAANAYYSPQKTALLFGYFRGKPARDGTGGGWVFTCLSQDIIAHETTHAILHGLRPRSIESANPDSLAFHEAFADIVALLQHFSTHHIVAYELGRSGGCLRSVSLLSGLAQQFGRATGREGPLRYALDMVLAEEKLLADGGTLAPDRNAGITEPHRRGQILVAAVFDAFVAIYDRRTADLLRIAGRPRGASDLPGDLIERLAAEAVKTADQVLRMCIRGLDYLPPVDVTFGDYLRAIVTADADLVPDDPRHYRIAFAEAFRKRGIGVDTGAFSSPDSLMWEEPEPFSATRKRRAVKGKTASVSAEASFADVLSRLKLGITYEPIEPPPGTSPWHRRMLGAIRVFPGARVYAERDGGGNRNLRDLSMQIVQYNALVMHQWLTEPDPNDDDWSELLGIALTADDPLATVFRGETGRPKLEVHSVRISRRQGPDGQTLQQLIVQVTQRRRGYFDPDVQKAADAGELDRASPQWQNPDFTFRGGATLLVDLNDGRVRRVVRKRIDNDSRLARQRAFLLGDPSAFTYGESRDAAEAEPFAFLHGLG